MLSRGVPRAKVSPLTLPPDRRVLVVSDIHGNLPFLKGVLKKANFSRDDILIVLGDILERSTGGLETLRYVMELRETHTVYPVRGNCDNIILAFVDRGEQMSNELFGSFMTKWGERWTAAQMAKEAGLELAPPREDPKVWAELGKRFRAELDFIREMPQILLNDDYLFVHGGVPRETRLGMLQARRCMKNDDFLSQGYSFRRWVIVGHWPVTLYREDIPSAEPIVLRDRHIVSIDGGCTLKWDGQLNALILPRTPGEKFSWVSYDGLSSVTALESQDPSPDPVNIRYGHSALEVLEEGPEFCKCRHIETGRVLDVLTEYIYRRDGRTLCEDSTDYELPVSAGDRLHVVRRTSRGLLAKKNGVTGWYRGRYED